MANGFYNTPLNPNVGANPNQAGTPAQAASNMPGGNAANQSAAANNPANAGTPAQAAPGTGQQGVGGVNPGAGIPPGGPGPVAPNPGAGQGGQGGQGGTGGTTPTTPTTPTGPTVPFACPYNPADPGYNTYYIDNNTTLITSVGINDDTTGLLRSNTGVILAESASIIPEQNRLLGIQLAKREYLPISLSELNNSFTELTVTSGEEGDPIGDLEDQIVDLQADLAASQSMIDNLNAQLTASQADGGEDDPRILPEGTIFKSPESPSVYIIYKNRGRFIPGVDLDISYQTYPASPSAGNSNVISQNGIVITNEAQQDLQGFLSGVPVGETDTRLELLNSLTTDITSDDSKIQAQPSNVPIGGPNGTVNLIAYEQQGGSTGGSYIQLHNGLGINPINLGQMASNWVKWDGFTYNTSLNTFKYWRDKAQDWLDQVLDLAYIDFETYALDKWETYGNYSLAMDPNLPGPNNSYLNVDQQHMWLFELGQVTVSSITGFQGFPPAPTYGQVSKWLPKLVGNSSLTPVDPPGINTTLKWLQANRPVIRDKNYLHKWLYNGTPATKIDTGGGAWIHSGLYSALYRKMVEFRDRMDEIVSYGLAQPSGVGVPVNAYYTDANGNPATWTLFQLIKSAYGRDVQIIPPETFDKVIIKEPKGYICNTDANTVTILDPLEYAQLIAVVGNPGSSAGSLGQPGGNSINNQYAFIEARVQDIIDAKLNVIAAYQGGYGPYGPGPYDPAQGNFATEMSYVKGIINLGQPPIKVGNYGYDLGQLPSNNNANYPGIINAIQQLDAAFDALYGLQDPPQSGNYLYTPTDIDIFYNNQWIAKNDQI